MEDLVREHLIDAPMTKTVLVVLVLAAMLEYVFPPVPGDVVVLAAAFQVGAADWPASAVLLAVNLGSLAGMFLDYEFGRFLARRETLGRSDGYLGSRLTPVVEAALPMVRRNAAWYLVVNRFLPGIRAGFFVAAGFADVPAWKVLVFGGLSALAWTLALFAVGYRLGADWQAVVDLLHRYTVVAYLAVFAFLTIFAYRIWRKVRKPA